MSVTVRYARSNKEHLSMILFHGIEVSVTETNNRTFVHAVENLKAYTDTIL